VVVSGGDALDLVAEQSCDVRGGPTPALDNNRGSFAEDRGCGQITGCRLSCGLVSAPGKGLEPLSRPGEDAIAAVELLHPTDDGQALTDNGP